MRVRESVRTTVRTGKPNLIGIAVTSVAVSLSSIPFLASLALGTVAAAVGGLWTTCLLLGMALDGLFRFASTAADRGVAVASFPHLIEAVRQPWTGVGLGAMTFVVVLTTLTAGFAPDRVRGTVLGLALFLLTCWYLLIAFAAPELGAGESLGKALWASGQRFARSPVAAIWFLLLSLLCVTIAGITVVTLFLFLPGSLGLLAINIADQGEDGSENPEK